ncbi:hypothetical protein CLV84_4275 [Neolewinella xylanilytica]|uniref:Secreted protein (Por secretion system target) n=1 Tax=Neolewinella xylanilytica TaxID=1514080 RepID=A0A2S6I0B6_9BACT|nr:hypothetical protein [Neolewinella xylanilytica]PPK84124.1 hypothetical protein CLV84_4275 [Neolewinella xylanilytica]
MKTCLSLLTLFLSVTLSASINPADLVVQADPTSKTLILRSISEFDADSKLQIVDRDGRVLHTAKLDSGSYLNARFQLAALPAGDYEIVLSDEMGRTVQPLTIGNTGIQADPALASRTFYPRVNLKESMLTITYLNTAQNEVAIRLADKNGKSVLNDRINSSPTLQRAYNLEQLPAGDYYVTVLVPREPAYTTSLSLK